jgi:hypothetical protein
MPVGPADSRDWPRDSSIDGKEGCIVKRLTASLVIVALVACLNLGCSSEPTKSSAKAVSPAPSGGAAPAAKDKKGGAE